MRSHSVRLVLLAGFTLLVLAGCEEKKPARMEVHPKGPFAFSSKGKRETLRLAFFDDKGRPYVRKPNAVFDAVDPSVVTVTAGEDGASATIAPMKTGATDVVVKAFGLSETVKVSVNLVGKVAFADGIPDKLKLLKSTKVKVQVFNDRGDEIKDHPPVQYRASDYCIDVMPDGTVKGVALGQCQVIASVGGVTIRHSIEVVD